MLKTEIIENYRKKHNLLKSTLASNFGILPSNYTMMIKRKSTTLLTLDRIAKVMKISAKKLIDD
jgi:antitoxin component HigA of HigAB toxin-antitoxin module